MAEPITIQKLIEASMDSDSLEILVNGDENAQVTTRLGETYPSAKKAIKTMFENGGLPATPFATKALMTDSALVDGDYAMVTEDTVNNGLYVKTAGAWVKSEYDPLAQAKADATTKANAAEVNAINYADSKLGELSDWVENNTFQQNFGQEAFKNQYGYNSSGDYVEGIGFRGWRYTDYIPVKAGDTVKIVTQVEATGFPYLLVYDQNKVRLQFFTVTNAQKSELTTFTHTFAQDGFFITQHTTGVTGCSIVINEGEQRFVLEQELPSKLNVAKAEAVAAAAIEATTIANAAEANAKTYTDANTKLKGIYEIVSTPETHVAIGGGISIDYSSSPWRYFYNLGLNSGLKAIRIEPNEVYTVLFPQTLNHNSIRLFWANSEFDLLKPESGTGVSLNTEPLIKVDSTQERYFQATSKSDSEIMLIQSSDEVWVIRGQYNSALKNYVSDAKTIFKKPLSTPSMSVSDIKTPMFGRKQNKNLFNGYRYGFGVTTTSANYEALGQEIGAGYNRSNMSLPTFKDFVSGQALLTEGETYTISKEYSDIFKVFLIKSDELTVNSGKGLFICGDAGVRKLTFTVPVGYDSVRVFLSEKGIKPKVQIEKGVKATNYQAPGIVFEGAESQVSPLHLDTITNENTYIDLKSNSDYFVRSTGLGGAFDVTPEQLLEKYYDDLVTDFPEYVTKNVLGKDATGTYDIHEFIFEPDNWEQKIVITSGMHPTERIPPVALGILLNEIYRKPEKHAGLAYLRNKVKIVVIPVVNTWGHNQTTRKSPEHYLNSNSVNMSRNFAERWDVISQSSVFDNKGSAPFSEAEAVIMRDLYIREKDRLAFTLDTHTGEGWDADTLMYWLQDDPFLRPSLENTVSMKSDAIRSIKGNTTPLIVTAHETQRALNLYWLWSVLGIPSATVEYGTGDTVEYGSEQAHHYVNQLFNYIHYALKERLYDKRMQAVKNEHNKPFVSLYNTLTAHNEVLNYKWTAAQLNTNLYDKLGMVKSTVNGSTVYTHTPSYYDKTVLLVSGAVSTEKKGITVLAFACHKLMTDSNPNLVGFRNNVRFIVAPLATAATVTAILAANTVDLVMEVRGTDTGTNPASYAKYQVLHKNGEFTNFGSNIAKVANKYGATINANVSKTDSGLALSSIAAVVTVPYQAHYFSKNLLPAKVIPEETQFVDYGYTAKEMSCCAELLFNSLANYVK